MSPKRFVVTITSNCHGFITSCMQHASMIRSSQVMPLLSYRFATSRPVSRKRPVSAFSTLALCTSVTFLRPCFSA
jgi:hypothetical protein